MALHGHPSALWTMKTEHQKRSPCHWGSSIRAYPQARHRFPKLTSSTMSRDDPRFTAHGLQTPHGPRRQPDHHNVTRLVATTMCSIFGFPDNTRRDSGVNTDEYEEQNSPNGTKLVKPSVHLSTRRPARFPPLAPSHFRPSDNSRERKPPLRRRRMERKALPPFRLLATWERSREIISVQHV
jgi:hypothetical protein